MTSTRSRRLLFTGFAKGANAPILLAACLHNVGSAAIKTSLSYNGKVDMPPIAVCHFHALYGRDSADQQCERPLRAFRGVGGRPLALGAQVHEAGQTLQPADADALSFLAKVEQGSLEAVLSLSSHNGFSVRRALQSSLSSQSFG